MFKNLHNHLLISLLFCLTGHIAYAQPKDNSPFSQFGVGDFFETDMPSSHAMGGLSAVYHDFFEANLENPASLGFLQYTSLQLGLYAKYSRLDRIGDKESIWSGNLDHISVNLPLINPLNEALERRESDFAWGTSVSLRPYSQVGYFIRINDLVDSIGQVERTFTGDGGLYQVSWGNGLKYKNFSAGINLGFIYGKQSFTEETLFRDLELGYRNAFESTTSYKGFNYRIGLLYEHPFDLAKARENDENPSRLLSAGLFFGGQSSLDTKTDNLQLAILRISNVTIDIDTATIQLDEAGEAVLPGTWGAGLMYRQSGKFRVGIDFQGASWSNYSNTARPHEMKDTYRIGFGAAWIPDADAIGSYFKRVEYRAGFYTLTDPRVIEEKQVKASAVTLGAQFPLILQRNIAWFQVGLDVGSRTGGDRLKENFIRGKVGFIFNDSSWFIRGKYN